MSNKWFLRKEEVEVFGRKGFISDRAYEVTFDDGCVGLYKADDINNKKGETNER